MSDIFHEALMEDAARINVTQITWAQVKQSHKRTFRKVNWKRRLFVYTASAAILAIVAIGASGFVSPVMAKALQKIPIIGKLYSFTCIPERNQYASDANPSITDKGITVSVPKVYYDGKRLYLIYAIQVPQGYKPINVTQVDLAGTKILLNGKPLSFESAQGGDSLVSTNMYRGDVSCNLLYEQAPQSGTLTIPIHEVGKIKGNWTLSVPVSSKAINKATKTVYPKNASTTYNGITITVNKITKGPIYTDILMQVRQPLRMNSRLKFKMPLNGMVFGVFTPNRQGIGGEFIGIHKPSTKVGNEEVWDDVTIQCKTPPDNVKFIIVEPTLLIEGVTGNSPNIPQLDVTVPLN